MVFHWHMQLVGVWLGGLAATLPLFALMVGLWYRRVRQFGA
jgi:hypothetical protein